MARGRWLLVAVSLVLLGLICGAAALLRREGARKSAAVPKAAAAALAAVEVTLPVHIRAQQIVPVNAQVSGAIEGFMVGIGDEVFEGQVLARIANPDIEDSQSSAAAALKTAQQRVSRLESDIIAARLEASRARADAQRARTEMDRTGRIWQRQKMLWGEGATPRLVYEKSEKEAGSAAKEYEGLDALARHADARVDALMAELDSAKTIAADKSRELEDVQAQLKAAEVRSPVTGVVIARRGEPGTPVSPADAELFQVAVNTALLEAVLEADPSALKRLSPGVPAMLFFADIPGEGIPAAIADIKGDQVRIPFTSPTPLIKPGMTAQVRLTLR